MLRDWKIRKVGPGRPTPASADPDETIFYSGSDMRILGTRRQLQEVANKMARVTGKKGTLNEGVVGDVAVVEGLSDGADHDDEWKPSADPSADVDRLAQAVVRGEVAAYSANPVDLQVIEDHGLNDRAHDVVLLADVGAAKE